MVEKWIHRECAKEDLNPEYVLVRPLYAISHTQCALCGQPFGHVFRYEVTEPVSKPAEEVLEEALEIAEEVVVEAITEPIETPTGPSVPYVPLEVEPELEVVAVIEEANEKETEIARLKAQIRELEK